MMTDDQLRKVVAESLAPGDLALRDDKELEAMLDAESHPSVTSRFAAARWPLAAAAAIAVLVLAIALVQRGRPDAGPKPEVVTQKPASEPVGPPAPEPKLREEREVPDVFEGTPPAIVKQDLPPRSEWVAIQPEYPKPMFVGTPVRALRPNLDTEKKPRLSFKAPPGTELLSLGAGITASDPAPIIGDLDMIVDGDKDGADGSYVELGPGRQWVQLDLGESYELWAVQVWHFHKNARAYDDVIVQLSDNPGFAAGVITVYNNDYDNSSGMGVGPDLAWVETNHGRIIDCEGQRGRYVRLYSNGNTANEMNHYVEVEVYGR